MGAEFGTTAEKYKAKFITRRIYFFSELKNEEIQDPDKLVMNSEYQCGCI